MVGVDRNRVAVDVLLHPRLAGEEIVEETAVDREVGVDQLLVGVLGLHLGHFGLGQIQTPGTRPHLDLLAGGVVQPVVVGHAGLAGGVALDGVDRSCDQNVGIEGAQGLDLLRGETSAVVEVDARRVRQSLLGHFPRAPQIAFAREVWVGIGQGSVLEVEQVARARVATDGNAVHHHCAGVQPGERGLMQGRALPGLEWGHFGVACRRAGGPCAVGGQIAGHGEGQAGNARGQEGAGRGWLTQRLRATDRRANVRPRGV